MIETYEEACKRTGRKWPYRTEEWPCPSCGKAECDLDVEMEQPPNTTNVFVYRNVKVS